MNAKLEKLIPNLLSDDLDIEGKALDDFYMLNDKGTFDVNDLIGLIEKAGSSLPSTEDSLGDPSTRLLFFAADIAEELGTDANPSVNILRLAMPSLTTQAKEAALVVLTQIPTRESVLAYTSLISEYAQAFQDSDLPGYAPEDIEGGNIADTIFPDIFSLASTPIQRYSLYKMMLSFFVEEKLKPDVLASYEGEFLTNLSEELGAIREHQGDPELRAWRYKSPYIDHRDNVALILDIVGWWATDALLKAIEALDDLHDPRLRLMRAVSLIRAGRSVPLGELEWIARSPRERFWMEILLGELEWYHKLPKICRDPKMLAEGAMVEWLCFPTELGREPDEIELVHIETRNIKHGRAKPKPTDYYFFRFCMTDKYRVKEDGWMLGMAGGYERQCSGPVVYTGDTFSHFNKWEELTLEEHIKSFFEDPDK